MPAPVVPPTVRIRPRSIPHVDTARLHARVAWLLAPSGVTLPDRTQPLTNLGMWAHTYDGPRGGSGRGGLAARALELHLCQAEIARRT
jgi:hypothetical protein